jgi:hypothetical protein
MPAPLNQTSGMPQMRAAFAGWAKPITLNKRVQNVTDGIINYTVTPYTFQGTIQPLSPKTIALKPEGQRAFTWLQIHALAGALNLDVDDQIVYNSQNYKIMAVLDYSLNNFIEYHAVQDYQP